VNILYKKFSVIMLIFAMTNLLALPPATGIRHDVDQVENLAEEILSIVEALDLETCPVTLVYNVPGGQTLTESGRYCLAEDILVTTTGIIIDGSSITLDLNNHSIVLTGTGAVGIELYGGAGNRDIRIKNGTVINIDPPLYSFINSPTPVFSNTGISVGVDNNMVYDARIEEVTCVGLDAGILLNHALNMNINQVICESCNAGLFGTNQINLFAQNSLFNNNVTGGVGIVNFSGLSGHSSKFINCGASNNGTLGFYFGSMLDFIVEDCFAFENNQVGFFAQNNSGISFVNCSAKSQVFGFVMSGSEGIMRECEAVNNSAIGFVDDQLHNQYYSNYACGNGTNYSGSVLSAPVTSPANARGVHNVDCSNSAVDEVDTILSLVENISSVVESVCPVTLVYDNHPFGQTLTEPGRYCLAQDITRKIIIAGNNITLDLNGHIINSTGSGILIGENYGTPYFENASFVCIKNGTITANGGNSITATGVSDLRIENVTCDGCQNNGNGIELIRCDGAIINNVICSNNQGSGIFLNSSSNVTVRDSSFVGQTNNPGFSTGVTDPYSEPSSNIIIQRCIMSNNSIGLSLDSDMNDVIVDCVAAHNSGIGFSLTNVQTAALVNCVSEDNACGDGFTIDVKSSNILIKECVSLNNGNGSDCTGCGFNNSSTTTLFYANKACDNNNYGFDDFSAGGSQYYANYACDNGGNAGISSNNSVNYNGVVSAPVTSSENARGVYNVDCGNSDVDELAAINSKIDVLLAR